MKENPAYPGNDAPSTQPNTGGFQIAIAVAFAAFLFGQLPPVSAQTSSNSPYPFFRGIYEFSGTNTSTDASLAGLRGTHLEYLWSKLEPTEGNYSFGQIDADMAPWVSAGKKVILRICTSGQAKWWPGTNSWTPTWLYTKYHVPYVTEDDGAKLPQYWNPIFLAKLEALLRALALKYDGNANIVFIDVGVGMGGETKPDTENNNSPDTQHRLCLWAGPSPGSEPGCTNLGVGYTDAVWWNAIQDILHLYRRCFRRTPLAVMPDDSFLAGTRGLSFSSVSTFAFDLGFWIQDNGFNKDKTNKVTDLYTLTTNVREQGAAAIDNGYPLVLDLSNAMVIRANYLLVFKKDIQNPTNQPDLALYGSYAVDTNTPPSTLAFEAESLAYTTNGATAALQTDANASGGQWIMLQADGVGDYIECTLPGIPAGTYQVKLLYKARSDRGVLSLKVDGTQLGGALDQYYSSSTYLESSFGSVSLAPGNHALRLTVTGKNAASTGYLLSADKFTLVGQ